MKSDAFTQVVVFYRCEDGVQRYTEFVPRQRDGGVFLSDEQASELREFLGRIIDDPTVFSAAHDIYDDAYVYLGWL